MRGKLTLVTLSPLGGVLTINFSAMPHAVHPYHASCVVNVVNHTVVADTNAPVIFRADQLAAPWWTRISS